ncbi:helix-turn-helix domain-containing protein [Coraliomargarita parva]|uniref:helix-turn-helix domain-containing protein n=1 Tax=Coraliomargarita parva TaxID=3014050 RepID=UPI0022B3C126|nr:helix-turn-helix transcriptional regulator [Coraliomargarita parva]
MDDKKERREALGKEIRRLLKLRNTKGKELAERLGVTPMWVSKILTGKAWPRRDTMSGICVALCHTDEEQNTLERLYSQREVSKNRPPLEALAENYPVRKSRAMDFLKQRTAELKLKRAVATYLQEREIDYQADFCRGGLSSDFLLNLGGKSIALECRPATLEQLDTKTEMLLAQELVNQGVAEETLIILPEGGELHQLNLDGIEFMALQYLGDRLSKFGV